MTRGHWFLRPARMPIPPLQQVFLDRVKETCWSGGIPFFSRKIRKKGKLPLFKQATLTLLFYRRADPECVFHTRPEQVNDDAGMVQDRDQAARIIRNGRQQGAVQTDDVH